MNKKSITVIFTLFCFLGYSQKVIDKNFDSDIHDTKRNLKMVLILFIMV